MSYSLLDVDYVDTDFKNSFINDKELNFLIPDEVFSKENLCFYNGFLEFKAMSNGSFQAGYNRHYYSFKADEKSLLNEIEIDVGVTEKPGLFCEKEWKLFKKNAGLKSYIAKSNRNGTPFLFSPNMIVFSNEIVSFWKDEEALFLQTEAFEFLLKKGFSGFKICKNETNRISINVNYLKFGIFVEYTYQIPEKLPSYRIENLLNSVKNYDSVVNFNKNELDEFKTKNKDYVLLVGKKQAGENWRGLIYLPEFDKVDYENTFIFDTSEDQKKNLVGFGISIDLLVSIIKLADIRYIEIRWNGNFKRSSGSPFTEGPLFAVTTNRVMMIPPCILNKNKK